MTPGVSIGTGMDNLVFTDESILEKLKTGL
jgi:hypothetical protein